MAGAAESPVFSARFEIDIPEWMIAELDRLPPRLTSLEERMSAVIRFSRLNFQQGTGGPFAAGVFERDSGRWIAFGVNRVVPQHCSSAHAEIVALSLAQNRLGAYDLGGAGLPAHQLVVNWRPCAMCFGAIPWSGVRSLAIAGSGPEMERITGFDEGPIHPDWRRELEKRGIEVAEDILRKEALEVFQTYAASGPEVYNSRRGST
jgi:tRNA(Arg) A34 adenosine deaminase TadA